MKKKDDNDVGPHAPSDTLLTEVSETVTMTRELLDGLRGTPNAELNLLRAQAILDKLVALEEGLKAS